MTDLTVFYYKLVDSGKLTLENVPPKWKEKVKDMLDAK